MTLQQEAVKKIYMLSDDSLRIIIAVADEAIRQQNVKNTAKNETGIDETTDKKKAFQHILKMREDLHFPKDFDYKKEMEEAIHEKYGFAD